MTLLEQITQFLTEKLGHIPSPDEIDRELNGAGLLIILERLKQNDN